jgi:divalent metal cation (Fe/Co/Zn/Cd) transporter
MRLVTREQVVRWAILLPIPLAPIAYWAALPHSTAVLALVWLAMALVCATAAHRAGLHRAEAVALAAIAVAATLVAGSAWLLAAFLSLCSGSSAVALAALAAGVLPYLLWGAIALRASRPIARLVGLPLAIAAGFALSLVVLAMLGGGPHYCET